MGARAGALAVAVVLAACSAAPPPSPSLAAATPRPTPTPTAQPTPTPTPTAQPTPTTAPEVLTADGLAGLVDAPALMTHIQALQAIADAHDGNRATGSAGFAATVDYVVTELETAGYVIERQSFNAGSVPSASLIAERPGSEDAVVMLGAHLDSVAAGPGINDNGSGVAALLVIAGALADLPAPQRTVRFAFWGAEEGGPFGSVAYVDALDSVERDRIVAYLNFDMLASPNAVRFVYDEDGAAPGSDRLTDLFAATMNRAGLAWEPIDLEGDSDHGPFSEAGIPTGGLFSGGIEPVTQAQAEAFGARAGEPADPCSHRACDTIDNVDTEALEQMARTIARVLVELAAP